MLAYNGTSCLSSHTKYAANPVRTQSSAGFSTVIDINRALVRSYVAYRVANSLLTIATRSLRDTVSDRIERRQELSYPAGPSFGEGQALSTAKSDLTKKREPRSLEFFPSYLVVSGSACPESERTGFSFASSPRLSATTAGPPVCLRMARASRHR